jgi:hypothetical protein
VSGSKTEYMLSSLPAPEEVSAEQVRAARMTTAGRNPDPERCLEALEMLGIGKVVEIKVTEP